VLDDEESLLLTFLRLRLFDKGFEMSELDVCVVVVVENDATDALDDT
jgi:hypothetical protein